MLRRVMPAAVMVMMSACVDAPTKPDDAPRLNAEAVKFWESLASLRWNDRATQLLVDRPPPNAQAAASRMLTYLSIAQYRAVLAAEAGKEQNTHPAVAAAVGAASAVVLGGFFPLDVATIEAQLDADLEAVSWPGGAQQDPVSGEAIGRAVGAAVLAQVAADNYLVVPVGTPPVGPGFWVSSGAAIVRGLHGTKPFFLSSPDQLRPPAPPAYLSDAFNAGLDEVRGIAASRTQEQTDIAVFWNTSTGPFTAGSLNRILTGLIRDYHRTEREATRILAYANAAAFDAQIGCWDAKLHYWFLRPVHADNTISQVFTMPNHPSYPSGHSCLTSAMMSVAAEAFPSERSRLEGIIEMSGMSRVFAGIHYRFDIEAGQGIGRGAAALALKGSLE